MRKGCPTASVSLHTTATPTYDSGFRARCLETASSSGAHRHRSVRLLPCDTCGLAPDRLRPVPVQPGSRRPTAAPYGAPLSSRRPIHLALPALPVLLPRWGWVTPCPTPGPYHLALGETRGAPLERGQGPTLRHREDMQPSRAGYVPERKGISHICSGFYEQRRYRLPSRAAS